MNKKGEEEELLMKETINIIIALLCIGVLIALVVILYFTVTTNQDAKSADAVVHGVNASNGNGGLENEIKRINSGGEDNRSFFVPNPNGWFIFSFTGDKKPNKCTGISCVCICQDVTYILDWQTRLANKCDDKGACAIVQNLGNFNKIQITKGGIFVSIQKINGMIEITKND